MKSAICPSSEDLERLAMGRVADGEAEQLAEHVLGCPRCAAKLEAGPLPDSLLAAIRKLDPLAEPTPLTGLGSLIERIEGLPHAVDGDAAPHACTTPWLSGGETIPAGDPGVRDLLDAPQRADELGRIGDYRVLGVIGRGGMGIVLQAEDARLNRTVAIKLILEVRSTDAQYVARFEQEGKAIARLHHPNIVQVYEVGRHRNRPYLVLEYAGGGTLAELIAGTPQSIASSARWMVDLARAVEHAHRLGIVHRDLKPANVLLESRAGKVESRGSEKAPHDSAFLSGSRPWTLDARPKITDFGLAKHLDEQGLTQTGDLLGTPSYMAPELTRGLGGDQIDERLADVYALGAILYELLTGRPPFRGETVPDTFEQVRNLEPMPPHRLQPGVPSDLETICLKCLAKEPKGRYASAAELADDLERFVHGQPILARPAGAWERGWKWARRKPAAAALAAVSLAALATITIGGWVVNLQLNEAVRQARAEQQRAERNAKRLKDTVNEMLWAVANQSLVEIPETEEVRRQLFDKARALYADLATDAPEPDLDAACNHAQLIWMLAAYYDGEGESDVALSHYEEVLRLQQALRERFPDQARPHGEFAYVQLDYGALLERLGRFEEAEAAMLNSLAILDAMPARFVENPWALPLPESAAEVHLGLAVRHARTNRQATAEAHFQKARQYGEHRLHTGPAGRTDWYLATFVADCYRQEGLFLYETGRTPEAVALIRQAVTLLEPISGDQRGLRRAQGYLGPVYLALGIVRESSNPAEAEELCLQALAIGTQLASQFPTVDRHQEWLSEVECRLGRRCLERGDPEEADRLLRSALARIERLIEQDAGFPAHRALQVEVLNDLGLLHHRRAQDDSAVQILERSLALAESLSSQFPAETLYAVLHAESHYRLGALHHEKGWAEQARAHVQHALRALEPVLSLNPQHPRAAELLADGTSLVQLLDGT